MLLRQFRKRQKHQWIMPNEDEYPEYYVRLSMPYPRFVKPYTYYQTHLSDSPDRTLMEPTLLADSIHQLREVPISARFGGLRRIHRPHAGLP